MTRGAMILGLCGAALAGCSGPEVPDSSAPAPAGLAAEAVAVANACLARDFAAEAVARDLRDRGYGARVPLVPMLMPADRALRVQVPTARPCELHVEREAARTVRGAMMNALRAAGYARVSGEPTLWDDGTRRVRLDRRLIQARPSSGNKVALSLSQAG